MLTERLAKRLFGGQSQAVGQTIKLHGLQFTIIGTFKERTTSFGQSEITGENVLIPDHGSEILRAARAHRPAVRAGALAPATWTP